MDGLQFLGAGIGFAGLSIATAQVIIVSIKNKSSGKYVKTDICDERTQGFSKEIGQFRSEMSSRLERIEGILMRKK